MIFMHWYEYLKFNIKFNTQKYTKYPKYSTRYNIQWVKQIFLNASKRYKFACIWVLRQIICFLKRLFSIETKARVENNKFEDHFVTDFIIWQRIIILQNVSNIPARFQIEGRPYRSKFRVIVQPVVENRGIVPPGMQLRLIILFRCDDIDTPEEVLVLNVQHGSSVIIRLHGYKDPPILLGIKITTK